MKRLKTRGKRVISLIIIVLLFFGTYTSFIHGENAKDIIGTFQEVGNTDKQSSTVTLDVATNTPDAKILKIVLPNGEIIENVSTVTYDAFENKEYSFEVYYSIVNNNGEIPIIEEKQITLQYAVKGIEVTEDVTSNETIEIQPEPQKSNDIQSREANPEADFTIPSSVPTRVYAADDISTENYSFNSTTGILTIMTNKAINDKGTSLARYNWDDSSSGIKSEDVIHVVINNGVTKIGNNAFLNETNIKSVSIPETVTTIEKYAFSNCASLEQIILPDGLENISLNTFEGCTKLSSVTIPESVKSIEGYAFKGCKALKQIMLPNQLESISNSVFTGSGLTSIEIPASVTEIGQYIFESCPELTKVTINAEITNLPGSAFGYCTKLNEVTIPESVKTISSGAFINCSSLKQIDLPSELTTLEPMAFSGSGITSIELPNTLNKIDGYMFMNCANLTSIIVPESIQEIGASAFSGSGITFVEMKSSIPPTINENAFKNLPDSYKILVPDLATYKTTGNWVNVKDHLIGIENVSFISLKANGTSEVETTTKLILIFDKYITELSANDITLTGATKGTLSKLSEPGMYELAISNITVTNNEDVTVAIKKTGFNFSTETMNTKVFLENTTQTLPSYKVELGANGVWYINSNDELLYKIDAHYADFKGVKIDGQDIDNNKYTSKQGSTIVILKPEYLNTLTVGKHAITIIFDKKEVTSEFTILKDTTPKPPESLPEIPESLPEIKEPGKELNPNVPNTGVETDEQQNFINLLLGAMGILGLCWYKMKNLEKQ